MVDLDEALRTLVLDRAADATEARRQFRLLLKRAHPDRGGDPAAARRLVDAYGVVAEALEQRVLPASPTRSSTVTVPDDIVELDIPDDDLFLRLQEALDDVATVTGADPDDGWLEAIVDGPPHPPAQLTVRLAPDPEGTRLLFTLESLDGRPAPPLGAIVDQVADAARRSPG